MEFRFRNKKHRRPPVSPQLFHPRLEPLEDRRLLAAAPLHVDIDSTAETPDGLAWETAYPSLQDALDQAATLNTDANPENDIDQIWIAEGTYTPTALSDADLDGTIDTDPRSATFSLINGVSLYGGFAGTEITLAERQAPIEGKFPHETILTGDLAGNDAPNIATADLLDHETRQDNAYTVVTVMDLAEPITLDGLTIIGGNASFTNDTFGSPNCYGGAIFNRSGTLTVTNANVSGNSANSDGGGVHNYNSSGTLTVAGSTISNNLAGYSGGGIESHGTSAIIDSTISGNSTGSAGGGIRSYGTATITNSTILGNSATEGGGVWIRTGTLTITDSTLSDNFARSGGAINGASDSLAIQRSSILNNSASQHGGAMHVGGDTITIVSSTIADNLAGGYGGGIYTEWANRLSVTDSIISANSASWSGGGVYGDHSTLTISNSIVSDNSTDADGGGLYNYNHHVVSIIGSTISDNWARDRGGGIWTEYGIVTILDSTVSGNSARKRAGGIYNRSDMTVRNSTISKNVADYGSGICNYEMLTVANSTISGNSAETRGGGIYNYGNSTPLTVTNSTISENSAGSNGGGIYISSGTVTAHNTIVAGNSALSAGPDAYTLDGYFAVNSSYNLIGDGTGVFDDRNGNLVGTAAAPIDPLLGPLGDYGGATWTMPLLAGSPAIDRGDPAVVDPPATDQRGGVRIVDGDWDAVARIDMGAFEYSPGETLLLDRRVFYGNSGFVGDDAIATDKVALRPGEVASFENYTSYEKGINGIVVDVAGLADPDGLTAADFLFRAGNDSEPIGWGPVANAATVLVQQGEGVGGSDRVWITWPDGSIVNQWLQVTVKANERTGLLEDDVFYFGNAVGEAGDQANNAIVNATDEIVARNFQHSAVDRALIDDPYDYNRDRLVNGTDQIIARNNQNNPLTMLRLISPPVAEAEAVGVQESMSVANPDWFYEFQQTDAKKDRAKKTTVEAAVDRLLAVEAS